MKISLLSGNPKDPQTMSWEALTYGICVPSLVSLHPIHQVQKLATILKSHIFVLNSM